MRRKFRNSLCIVENNIHGMMQVLVGPGVLCAVHGTNEGYVAINYKGMTKRSVLVRRNLS